LSINVPSWRKKTGSVPVSSKRSDRSCSESCNGNDFATSGGTCCLAFADSDVEGNGALVDIWAGRGVDEDDAADDDDAGGSGGGGGGGGKVEDGAVWYLGPTILSISSATISNMIEHNAST